jgi:hypothetical protein
MEFKASYSELSGDGKQLPIHRLQFFERVVVLDDGYVPGE